MRVLVLMTIFALAAFGKHRGGGFGGGGGGRGFGGGGRGFGGFSGTGMRSPGFHTGYGGGFRGSVGGYRGWGGAGLRSYGWHGGYGFRSGFGGRGYYGGYYGGIGYWGAPYYSVWPSIGFYYDSLGYSPYYGVYGGWGGFPYPYVPNTTVTVVSAVPPDQPSYPIAIYTEPRRTTTASAPAIYLIALNDGTIWAASDYFVENGKLNIITRQHERKEFSLNQVDRGFTEQLNRERGIGLRLPAPAHQ